MNNTWSKVHEKVKMPFERSPQQGGFMVVGVVLVLALVYLGGFWFSSRGWGYAGYGGYHRAPSFWYWGGPSTYHDPSVRAGSVGGPSHRGGGLHGGK